VASAEDQSLNESYIRRPLNSITLTWGSPFWLPHCVMCIPGRRHRPVNCIKIKQDKHLAHLQKQCHNSKCVIFHGQF
jgi:hypothetical protein